MRSPANPLAFLLVLVATTLSVGCGLRCEQLREDYRVAKGAERTDDTEKRDAAEAPQFALSVRTAVIENHGSALVGAALRDLLAVPRTLEVGGKKPVDVRADTSVESLDVSRASEACPHCIRLQGTIAGTLDVQIPMLGTRSVPIDTAFDFAAPILLSPAPDGDGTSLLLDVAKATRHNTTPMTLSVTGLPESWQTVLSALLESELVEAGLKQLDPIRIATFRTPDFGWSGFRLQPTGIRISKDGTYVTALAGSTVPAGDLPSPASLAAAAQPPQGRSIGLAVPPAVVRATVAHAIRRGAIPRRYNRSGRADSSGPIRVTLDSVRLADTDSSENSRIDYELAFQAWKLDGSGSCFCADGLAVGDVSADGTSLTGSIRSVKFSKHGLDKDAGKWRSADFLEEGTALTKASLDATNLHLPDERLAIDDLRVGTSHGFLTLTGVVTSSDDN